MTGSSIAAGGEQVIATVAYDTTGAVRWLHGSRTPPVGRNPTGIAVDVTTSNVYVGGTTRAGTDNANFVTLAYSGTTGATLWSMEYNGPATWPTAATR